VVRNHRHLKASLEQVGGHRLAHGPYADESHSLCHGTLLVKDIGAKARTAASDRLRGVLLMTLVILGSDRSIVNRHGPGASSVKPKTDDQFTQHSLTAPSESL
jgi:hypothetical protein